MIDPALVLLMAPLVSALLEVGKRAGLATRHEPLLAVVLGLGAALLFAPDPLTREAVILGLSTGLAACGVYDVVDHTVTAVRGDVPEAAATATTTRKET